MFRLNKIIAYFLVLINLCSNLSSFAIEANISKNPDYSQEFIGEDKFEAFNRKMFKFNTKLNKYALKPIHIIWASLVPKYGMDRLQGIYENALFPRKVVSNLVQGKFKSAGQETVRFFANTTVGLGGMFDPAKKYLKIESTNADMEQALAKCKVKSGPYMVCPILTSTNPRAIIGKVLDMALDPSTYLGLPIASLVKLGFTINRTAYFQPMMAMLESDYADPYEIAKKFYGVTNYLKNNNIVETQVAGFVVDGSNIDDISLNFEPKDYGYVCFGDVMSEKTIYEEVEFQSSPDITVDDGIIMAKIEAEKNDGKCVKKIVQQKQIKPDIVLKNYNPQNPVIDAMRTAFFELPDGDKSMWSGISVWNRSFNNRLKSASINLVPQRSDYKFRYLLQPQASAPVAIIFPSIGENYRSHHSVVLGKLFYDKGYSVIIVGSHFQWEFVKSMPNGTIPGLPNRDVDLVQMATYKVVNYLESKYKIHFGDKVVIGTSFGAMMTLFLADKEDKDKVIGISKYIAVNPPIELVYAMQQFDRNNEEWIKAPETLKYKVAIIASKIQAILSSDEVKQAQKENLPFNEEDAKLITGFILHQKLSDLIFTLENGSQLKDTDALYKIIHNMNYRDYVNKYLLSEKYKNLEDFNQITSLHSISNYLKHNNNYRIYHSVDDYLINTEQLLKLKNYCGNNLTIISNGSHLGFLYRQEFIDALSNEITIKKKGQYNDNEEHGLVSLAK